MNSDFDNNDTPVIDLELGLSLANNSPDLAENLLKMLVNDLPATQKNLMALYEQQDHENLRKEVHKLHGGCCYCGVPRLKAAAAALETALKNGHTSSEVISPLFEALTFEMDQVMNCYAAVSLK